MINSGKGLQNAIRRDILYYSSDSDSICPTDTYKSNISKSAERLRRKAMVSKRTPFAWLTGCIQAFPCFMQPVFVAHKEIFFEQMISERSNYVRYNKCA